MHPTDAHVLVDARLDHAAQLTERSIVVQVEREPGRGAIGIDLSMNCGHGDVLVLSFHCLNTVNVKDTVQKMIFHSSKVKHVFNVSHASRSPR
jgi:hypothetical protein